MTDIATIETGLDSKTKKSKNNKFIRGIKKSWQLYILVLPALVYIIIFNYIPLYGIQLAFKKYMAVRGIWGSPWVGLRHFETLFNSSSFIQILQNTIGVTLYSLIAGFPIPIILALLLHNLTSQKYKKVVQMVSYAPHFLSVVVVVGILNVLLAPELGLINVVIKNFGIKPIYFMAVPEYFKSIYVWSGIWQSMGFSSIIYIAALSSIDPSLYEAAVVDGASRLQKIRYIDIPSIMPTAVILLILNSGQLLNVGFEKVFLMQNPLNLKTSEVISTYVYRVGILGGGFEFGTAVGLFNSVASAIMLLIVNQISKKLSNSSLF